MGEEKFAKKIARNICTARSEKPIETTGELIELIKQSIPMKMRAVGGHPAKKTFQAIRYRAESGVGSLEKFPG